MEQAKETGKGAYELVVKTKPATIEENLKDLEVWLVGEITPFVGQEKSVSVDNLKDAKKSLADLRKLQEQLEKKRKSIKNQVLKPYKDFEGKYKKAVDVLTKHIFKLDNAVKNLEEKQKQEKLEKIEAMIAEKIEDLEENLQTAIKSIPTLRNPKWINKAYSLSKIDSELDDKIDDIRNDLMTLSEVEDEYFAIALETYRNAGLSRALLKVAEQKKQKEELRRFKEASKAEKEEKIGKSLDWDIPIPVESTETAQNEPTSEDILIKANFTVTGKKSDISRIKAIIQDMGLEWKLNNYKFIGE